jgi:hypothetical protein
LRRLRQFLELFAAASFLAQIVLEDISRPLHVTLVLAPRHRMLRLLQDPLLRVETPLEILRDPLQVLVSKRYELRSLSRLIFHVHQTGINQAKIGLQSIRGYL